MGYPVLPQPPMPATCQPHLDSMNCGISNCHVVNGVPAPSNYHTIRMNSGNDMLMDSSGGDMAPVIPLSSAMSPMSEMAMSPTSMASSSHFPFTASEKSVVGLEGSLNIWQPNLIQNARASPSLQAQRINSLSSAQGLATKCMNFPVHSVFSL